jgi:1-phosphofructokinase
MPDARARKPEGIAVFTPSPLFTVTIEEGTAGEPHAADVHFHAGGQGFWVARMARGLGAATTLCGPFAGESGRILRVLIESEDVTVRATECSRPNGGYVHDRRGKERRVVATVPSPELDRHESDDLYNAALTTGLAAGVAVLTGPARPEVLDADTFRRLALDLSSNGVRVVADLSAAALLALRGGVDFLKVSHEEVIAAGLAQDAKPASLVTAGEALREQAAMNVIVSRADQPALALIEDRWLELRPPRLEVADHRGAGDSMTAALAVGLVRGLDAEETVQLAGAAGALNVTRHGLATGTARDIEALRERVELRAFSG